MKPIPFSPPDITEEEIQEVTDTLRSGWITTGPKTRLFESKISEYCGTERTICLNSATAGLELVLRLFDITEGDEVITTPYTFAASANVILHTGAKPVFADVLPGGFNIDPEKIMEKITERTKAVIVVDFAGWMCDFDAIGKVLATKRELYRPKKGTLQEKLDKPLLLVDAAHSFGASYKGKMSGSYGDFTVFSFHAVKNLTTGEGGAVTFNSHNGIDADEMYRNLQLLSLHGQSKDAFTKMKAGGWFYDITLPGYKYNMTDIAASLGLIQLKRFDEMQKKRKMLHDLYSTLLKNCTAVELPDFTDNEKSPAYHIMPVRIHGIDETRRSKIIELAAAEHIALNVHFIPVTMHPAYTSRGYTIEETPRAYTMYRNEITLPLYSTMTETDVERVSEFIVRTTAG